MFAKLVVAVVFLSVLAAAVLGLREQRLAIRHKMAELHAEMDQSRTRTWDLQVRVERAMRGSELRRAIDRVGLAMEPHTQPRPAMARDVRVVQAEPGGAEEDRPR